MPYNDEKGKGYKVKGEKMRAQLKEKPKAASNSSRLEARLNMEDKALMVRAAKIEGTTLKAFIVSHALKAARQTIHDAEVIKLSLEDQKRFAEAISNPVEPNEALIRASEKHKRISSK